MKAHTIAVVTTQNNALLTLLPILLQANSTPKTLQMQKQNKISFSHFSTKVHGWGELGDLDVE